MEYSFEKATALGYDVIVIFGHPGNYVGVGFKSCKKYNDPFLINNLISSFLITYLRV